IIDDLNRCYQRDHDAARTVIVTQIIGDLNRLSHILLPVTVKSTDGRSVPN
ncbi:23_t:CDS:2, partial [Paraglomus brasilianum]